MWVLAGPSATRVLADHGAEVVRIESTRRIDTARTLAPFHDGSPGAERSALFHNTNASKRMLTLDPTRPGRPRRRPRPRALGRRGDGVVLARA